MARRSRETMEALHDVVKADKAPYRRQQHVCVAFAKAQSVAPTRFASMQNHYNLIYCEEEREMIPQCIDRMSAYCPGARSHGGC